MICGTARKAMKSGKQVGSESRNLTLLSLIEHGRIANCRTDGPLQHRQLIRYVSRAGEERGGSQHATAVPHGVEAPGRPHMRVIRRDG